MHRGAEFRDRTLTARRSSDCQQLFIELRYLNNHSFLNWQGKKVALLLKNSSIPLYACLLMIRSPKHFDEKILIYNILHIISN